MSRGGSRSFLRILSFPRVSGDEPHDAQMRDGLQPFSPRERG